MTKGYVVRRVATAAGTLLGMSVIVFLVLRVLPGDEITARLGVQAGNLTPAQRQALEEYFGLNQPLVVQYFAWLGDVLRGNFGVSITSGQPLADSIARALPVTVELAILAQLMGTSAGVALGVFVAARPNGLRDVLGQAFGLLGLAVPHFVLGSAMVSILAQQFGYFPSAGSYVGLLDDPFTNLQQQLYPALVLSVGLAAAIMRTTRSAYLEIANQDFVRTARGKGVPEGRIRWAHIVRNALIPIVTISGIQFGYLLGGAVVVEQIFNLPGIGRLLLTGILQREFALVQSTALVIAAAFVTVNLLVDLLYARLDPRVKLS